MERNEANCRLEARSYEMKKDVKIKPPTLQLKATINQPKTLLKVQFYKDCLILAEELYKASEPDKQTPNISGQRRRRLYGAIIFLALALESFINEIGIDYCPNEFDSLGKLRAPDKWDIILKLKKRKPFEKSKEPFQSITKIFRYRNLFVHFKPQFKEFNHKDYEDMRKVTHSLVKKLHNNTVKAMKIIHKEFNIPNLQWLDTKTI